MAFAWLPKATVQAALGPIFLDNVIKLSPDAWEKIGNKDDYYEYGNNILTLAVLSILITAPLGAVCILGLGPKLLESDKPNADDRNVEHDEESSH